MRLPLLAILKAWSLGAAPPPEAVRWEKKAQNVSIIRDDWGIAHVFGKSDADTVSQRFTPRLTSTASKPDLVRSPMTAIANPL